MILLFLILLFILLLTHSAQALLYASEGLLLWFNHMLPALFPCIVWSNIMIETESCAVVTKWFYPVLHRIFGLSGHGSFVLLVGFTGGFPLGAKLSADLCRKGLISPQEAAFLLSFCNNLGPVYLSGFLFPLLNISYRALCFAILYGIPLLYGKLTYHLVYRGIPFDTPDGSSGMHAKPAFSSALDTSVHNAVGSIVMLGAYVIFFQVIRLFYLFLPEGVRDIALLFTEINGGINRLGTVPDSCILIFGGVTFGGLCCIAQTDHVIHGTALSTKHYILHKLIQSVLVFCAFYACRNVLHIPL